MDSGLRRYCFGHGTCGTAAPAFDGFQHKTKAVDGARILSRARHERQVDCGWAHCTLPAYVQADVRSGRGSRPQRIVPARQCSASSAARRADAGVLVELDLAGAVEQQVVIVAVRLQLLLQVLHACQQRPAHIYPS